MAKIIVSTDNLPYGEWLEYRRNGIGGSDAAVVCGISRYKSPFELQLDKIGQPYAVYNFEAVDELEPEEAENVRLFGRQFMDRMNTSDENAIT